MKRSEIAAKLNAAADLIVLQGWFNGTNDGQHCAITALASVSDGDDEPEQAFRRFLGLPAMTGLAVWNDRQPNQNAVIAALREAARATEETTNEAN